MNQSEPITQLEQLKAALNPQIQSGSFCFCVFTQSPPNSLSRHAVGRFEEQEGTTLILPSHLCNADQTADTNRFKQITLQVHSSLHAVGLTALVSSALAQANISANVVAAYYHDHVFVPEQDADRALGILTALSG